MFPLELCNLPLEAINVSAKSEHKTDLKITFMNMIEDLKDEMNNTLKDICKNTNSGRK